MYDVILKVDYKCAKLALELYAEDYRLSHCCRGVGTVL